MNDPESKPPKDKLVETSRLFDGIDAVANAQAVDAVQPDELAITGEEDLSKDYPEALSRVQEARDVAEIKQLGEVVRQTKRVNVARLIVLGSLFFLIVLWIVSVVLLTIALGFRWRGYWLPDLVMITYITTTTASVFGLFHIAAKWLFPTKKDE